MNRFGFVTHLKDFDYARFGVNTQHFADLGGAVSEYAHVITYVLRKQAEYERFGQGHIRAFRHGAGTNRVIESPVCRDSRRALHARHR